MQVLLSQRDSALGEQHKLDFAKPCSVCLWILQGIPQSVRMGKMVQGLLICGGLKPQINVGVRIQEVDKELGHEMASETLVGLLSNQ